MTINLAGQIKISRLSKAVSDAPDISFALQNTDSLAIVDAFGEFGEVA